MKTTKRIFAILTALVLCLANMTMIVGAAENSDIITPTAVRTCGCGSTQFYIDTSYEEFSGNYHPVGTNNICRYQIWYTGILICLECEDVSYYTELRNPHTHPTFHFDEDRGCYYCNACGYIYRYVE